MQPANSPARGVKFLGSHLHQLDDKGRVSLPISFRREAADQRFILVQAYEPSLALYPEVAWLEVEERLAQLMGRDAKARMYVLGVMANAVEVSPDAQGRILIPARLKEVAGLEGQALLVGAIDKVEIWNPDRFEQEVTGTSEDFGRFAHQIFR
jgi:MraZ protein